MPNGDVDGAGSTNIPTEPAGNAPSRSRARWFSRRSAVVAGTSLAFGYLFGDRVRHQLARTTSPAVDELFARAGNALGQDLLRSTVTMLPVAYGTLPVHQWEAAGSDLSITDEWVTGTPPIDFVSSWIEIVVELVARRPAFFTGTRLLMHDMQPLGDRRSVSNAGGGNGDALHCYIGVQDERVSIRYATSRQDLYEAIRIRVSKEPDAPTTVVFTVLPRDPILIEASLLLNFASEASGETTNLQIGPFTASGVPPADSLGLYLGGPQPEVTERRDLEGPYLKEVLEGLGFGWP